ncbi:hypothetical protein MLD38_000662 [Melastoma candidum]|uniref:Uncharacterized protein n=1 Tax=Melastoma candidum TaxID=119954 RepID=A0ACB9SER3_9MYRT|nr:hypothetical protein MLD38_000662 [Melastoma candidum]
MEEYVANVKWWGDVSGALLLNPKMLRVSGIERKFVGPDSKGASAYSLSSKTSDYADLMLNAFGVVVSSIRQRVKLYLPYICGPPYPTVPRSPARPSEPQQSQDDFDAFTIAKATELAKPLKEAGIPYKIHIVKDHDMKERLCLEVERLGLSAVIMGSRGFGAARRGSNGRLGSVSDYCVHHCVCPVVVVRYPEDKDNAGGNAPVVTINEREEDAEEEEEHHQKVA